MRNGPRFQALTLARAVQVAVIAMAPVSSFAEDDGCIALFAGVKEGRAFPAWSLAVPFVSSTYRPDDFLPPDYLAALAGEGFEASLLFQVYASGKGSFKLWARARGTAQMIPVAKFDFWAGGAAGSVIVESFGLRDPLNKADRLHASQAMKGLPIRVALEFRKNLYGLFVAGGFRNLEVLSSQNFLVAALYRRLLGGAQSPEGRDFSRYLDGLYRIASSEFPEEFRVRDLDRFSKLIGDYLDERIPANGSAIFPAADPVIFDEALERRLVAGGARLLKDRLGRPVAIADRSQLLFLYPDGKGYRPLRWSEIYRRHPEYVRVDVPLADLSSRP